MGRTAIYNEKMTFRKIVRKPKPKKESLTLDVDEPMVDIKNKLKKKVVCITEAEYLTIDKAYKINAEIESKEFESGKGIIIINDNNETVGYDSSLFMYIYDGIGLDPSPKEIISSDPVSAKVKSPVRFRGTSVRTAFLPQK